jgi:methionyl aminopeptidase
MNNLILGVHYGHTYKTKDGKRSAHFEHTIVITKNGPEILTKV